MTLLRAIGLSDITFTLEKSIQKATRACEVDRTKWKEGGKERNKE